MEAGKGSEEGEQTRWSNLLEMRVRVERGQLYMNSTETLLSENLVGDPLFILDQRCSRPIYWLCSQYRGTLWSFPRFGTNFA